MVAAPVSGGKHHTPLQVGRVGTMSILKKELLAFLDFFNVIFETVKPSAQSIIFEVELRGCQLKRS